VSTPLGSMLLHHEPVDRLSVSLQTLGYIDATRMVLLMQQKMLSDCVSLHVTVFR